MAPSPALLELWETDGKPQKQLIVRLDIEQPTKANTLARMERDGLFLRKKGVSNGRVQWIWLTEPARDLRHAATQAAMTENAEALASVSEDEQRQFTKLKLQVIAAGKHRADPTPS